MISCDRCGQQGITLPCPACGWLGDAVARPAKRARRHLPTFFFGLLLTVTGALLVWPAGLFLAAAAGYRLTSHAGPAAQHLGVGAGLVVGALVLGRVGLRFISRSGR